MSPIRRGLQEGMKPHQLAAKCYENGRAGVVSQMREEMDSEDKRVRNFAVKTLSHLAGHQPQ